MLANLPTFMAPPTTRPAVLAMPVAVDTAPLMLPASADTSTPVRRATNQVDKASSIAPIIPVEPRNASSGALPCQPAAAAAKGRYQLT